MTGLATPLQAADGALDGDATKTRFVMTLGRTAEFQVFSLPSPNRVIVEMSDVPIRLPELPANGIGLVKSFRSGLAAPGKMRIVIDVTQPVVVESAVLEKGKAQPKLSLEIVPLDGNRDKVKPQYALGGTGNRVPVPRRAISKAQQEARIFKPVIVIDPGHGGHDSGAVKHGTVEKNVVLAFGLMLRDKLEKSGRYRVLMTRDNDKFIPLDERREFAEKNSAALFIAVHADYASTNARGATIYSARDAMVDRLSSSAKKSVQTNVLTEKELTAVKANSKDAGAVTDILKDLASREVDVTKERTDLLTRSVIANMGASTSMRDNPDRNANFRVLLTAQMPAILIELAYVSNRQDAKLLQSDSWRDEVSGSIVTAVDNYFSHQLARLPMAAQAQ